MYAGTTLTTYSGRLLGAHQKIDRTARRRFEEALPGSDFPSVRRILYFEGGNGPDAIKRKSPAQDEPWHFIQPFDDEDTVLTELLTHHYELLQQSIREKDVVRASFEAAWLSHALVDGLTPAHHYPYEEKLEELRGGEGKETRNTVLNKIIFPGDTLAKQAHNNWKYWGTKGVFTTHTAFEWGVATIIMPMRLKKAAPTRTDIDHLLQDGIARWFRGVAQEVAGWELYDRFYKEGWSPYMIKQVRRKLAPIIVKTVATAWLAAYESGQGAE
jgi:hypothetical protein